MPPRMLARWLSARDAAELLAFARYETLDPIGWAQAERLAELIAAVNGAPLKGFIPVAEPPESWGPARAATPILFDGDEE